MRAVIGAHDVADAAGPASGRLSDVVGHQSRRLLHDP